MKPDLVRRYTEKIEENGQPGSFFAIIQTFSDQQPDKKKQTCFIAKSVPYGVGDDLDGALNTIRWTSALTYLGIRPELGVTESNPYYVPIKSSQLPKLTEVSIFPPQELAISVLDSLRVDQSSFVFLNAVVQCWNQLVVDPSPKLETHLKRVGKEVVEPIKKQLKIQEHSPFTIVIYEKHKRK